MKTAPRIALLAFLAGAGGAAAQAPDENCAALLPAECLETLGAGAAALAPEASCRTHLDRYGACLSAAAGRAPARGGRAADPLDNAQAKEAYDDAARRGSAEAMRDVSELFPTTYWGRQAAREAERLAGGAPAPAETATTTTAAPAPAPTPPVSAGVRSFRDCADCPAMIAIPGGGFRMGSPATEAGRGDDEGPQREVRIAPFAIGADEVTFAEWDSCLADGGCGGYRPEDKGWGRGVRPAIHISWDDAQAYVAWLNTKIPGAPYRLPSEAEWEYAARAGTRTRYSWGDAWEDGRASKGTKSVAVGSYPANGFGLHDVHGNVWEWVADCSTESYAGAPADGRVWEAGDCDKRVIRGGSWYNFPEDLRSANRGWNDRGHRYYLIGFRVARTLAR